MTDTTDPIVVPKVRPEPKAPELPELPPVPGTDALTSGQRDTLNGMIGEVHEVLVAGKVDRWEPSTDADGRPVALVHFVTDDGLDFALERRIEPTVEDRAKYDEDVARIHAAHAEEVAAWEEEHRAYQAEVEARDSAIAERDARAAREAEEANAAAQAARFTDAVDERVREVLAELGITPSAPPGS